LKAAVSIKAQVMPFWQNIFFKYEINFFVGYRCLLNFDITYSADKVSFFVV